MPLSTAWPTAVVPNTRAASSTSLMQRRHAIAEFGCPRYVLKGL
jgi:hypothetical protein